MVWMRMVPIGLYIWKFGLHLEPFEKDQNV